MSSSIKSYWNGVASEATDWDYYHPTNPERLADIRLISENPEKAFPAIVYSTIQKYLGGIRGKKVCVPSSGDNKAAFAFHLLGARVTSCDISENQLANAKRLADEYKWDIEFVCADSMTLAEIGGAEYDLIYTSNGAHVWIDDLPKMYGNFNRVLKPGGFNLFFETHPVIRPFDNGRTDVIKIKKPFEDVMPSGGDMCYEWRMQDFINAIAFSGFRICEMQEFHTKDEDLDDYLPQETNPESENFGIDMKDWRQNPWAALPQCFCVCSQKPFYNYII